jgi:hypothetical protein
LPRYSGATRIKNSKYKGGSFEVPSHHKVDALVLGGYRHQKFKFKIWLLRIVPSRHKDDDLALGGYTI